MADWLLDDLDVRILRRLQLDGRASVLEISRELGRSATAVSDRIAALHAAGYLAGYRARVDWSRLGLAHHAVVWGTCRRPDQVRQRLEAMPDCTEAHLLPCDRVMAVFAARDPTAATSLARRLLADGVFQRVELRVALDVLVEGREPPAAEALAPQLVARARGRTGKA